MKTLRPYQQRALDRVRASFGSGKKRPILQLSTGGGKTVIAANIARGALEKGRRTTFVVDAISLIDQTVERFYEDGITEVGVIQADHPMTDWSKPVQVASIQTLKSRGVPETDLVIVDECHCRHERIWQWMDERPDLPFIGLSATPWSKGLGLRYDDLVIAETTQGLIDAGFLCPFRTFAAAHPDLGNVKTRMGEYAKGELAEAMNEGGLVADIVQTWIKLGDDRPTIAFCVDRAHAKAVQTRFQAAGIGCGYIDAHTPADERKATESDLNAGRIRIVASVDCLTKGVDWSIGCLIVARPTQSVSKWVQMIGRGLRVNPDAGPDCIILDHSDNTLRLGMVTDINFDTLDDSKEGKGEAVPRKEALPKECGKCGWIKPPKVHECPACGFVPEVQTDIEEQAGELVQVNGEALKATKKESTKEQKQLWYSGLLFMAREGGRKDGWAAHKYKERFGVWPRGLLDMRSEPPQHIRSWVRSRNIAWAKSQKKDQPPAANRPPPSDSTFGGHPV